MQIGDFKTDELFSFRAADTLWGEKVRVFVEFNDDYDPYDTLVSYLEVINERLSRLAENRAAVAAVLIEDGIHDRLRVSAEELSEKIKPDEVVVYCDDGRDNVWTDLFVKYGETSVQLTLSPENTLESKGICS